MSIHKYRNILLFVLLIIASAVVLVSITVSRDSFFRDDENTINKVNDSTVEVAEPPQDEVEAAINTHIARGILSSVTAEKITIAVSETSQALPYDDELELFITESTIYQQGSDYRDSTFEQLTTGVETEVSYNQVTGTLYATWQN